MPPLAPPTAIGFEERLLTFAVSLLVGGVALHAGIYAVSSARDYAHAVLTALLGALVWALLELVDIGPLSALGVPGS
ncbi:hypothetical protein GCU68_07540 [Natronorubrum aibiense]|uniref:Uncharacterized protein n=1 Tax=Natronorubrum aibiense TaxID=348826 RepID=A0A5P9P2R5_9EURY|nr:hypothetical protein [Natronorubrum aibiense]QFU82387.1 hypothetical protein GCU68_07540 [Natronorubrum aibiense]